jgi:quercetin dioxygenase-like cupin family protein
MSRKRVAQAATVLGAVVLIGVFALSSTAQEPPPPPIATEFLTARAVFPDDIDLKIKIKSGGMTVVNVKDPSRTVVARITVQPGVQFPWHSHAGPVVVNMVEGELVYIEAEGCAEHTYPAGTAFVDPGSHVHTAVNRGDEPVVLVATYFAAPAEGPLSIPADPADC